MARRGGGLFLVADLPGGLSMNVPIGLTVSRLLIVPLFVAVLLARGKNFELWGLAILLAAGLTDWLDGYLARKRRQITPLGVLLDPIADKLFICSAFIVLVELGLAPAWMVVIIVSRELAVQGLRTIATAEGFTVAVSELGKVKMALQVCTVGVLILGSRQPALKPLGMVALWLVVFFALVSAARYFAEFWRHRAERSRQRRAQLLVMRPEKKRDVAAH